MPGLDGYEVCARLKEDEKTAHIPVLFLTAKTGKQDIAKGFAVGGLDYVLKPFSAVELLARVGAHIRLKMAQDQLRQKNRQLGQLAAKDGLTGLYNHRTILEILQKRISESARHKSPLSIFMFDIDRFKAVNDTYGHKFGDQVLEEIAHAIQKGVRESDICGRYGGEEFVIILPNTPASKGYVLAEKLRKKIKALPWPKKNLSVTISGGLVSYQGGDTDRLIIRADKLLYAAKQKGRDRIVHHPF